MMYEVHTVIRGILQTGIGDERDRRVKTFCITQTFHDHVHFLAPELIFNAFKCSFKRKPEIDFLRCRARRNIAIKLRHSLDRLDPRIDVCV